MKFYIYALIDPRDLKPFYVGKGSSARRFNHMKNIPNSTVGPKGQRIAEIVEAGFTVQPAVLSWHSTEEEAYEAERKKIAEIGLENLTNKAIGGNGGRKIHQVKLTSKQEQFARLVAAGESQSDAYRATYNCQNTLDKTIHESASRAAAAMIRGWKALDQAATQAGAAPLSPVVWETTKQDGTVIALVRTPAEASAVAAEGRQVEVWTIDEVARLSDATEFVAKVKQAFPGAKIVDASKTDIPFDDLDHPIGI